MKTKFIAIIASSIMLSCSVHAQTATTLHTQGDGFAFSLSVPSGWVNDPKATEGQHLKGLLLPQGTRWETAGSRMYTSISDLDISRGEGLSDVIEYDVRAYKTVSECTVTQDAPIALTHGHQSASIMKIAGAGDGYEAIAYFKENKAIPFLILSSTSKEAFERDYAVFKEVVASYIYSDNSTVAHD